MVVYSSWPQTRLQSWDGVVGPWANSPPNWPNGLLGSSVWLLNPQSAKHHRHGCSFPDVIGLRCWDLHDLQHCHKETSFLSLPLVLPPASCDWLRCRTNGPATTMTLARPAEEGFCRGNFGHWCSSTPDSSSRGLCGPRAPQQFHPLLLCGQL